MVPFAVHYLFQLHTPCVHISQFQSMPLVSDYSLVYDKWYGFNWLSTVCRWARPWMPWASRDTGPRYDEVIYGDILFGCHGDEETGVRNVVYYKRYKLHFVRYSYWLPYCRLFCCFASIQLLALPDECRILAEMLLVVAEALYSGLYETFVNRKFDDSFSNQTLKREKLFG